MTSAVDIFIVAFLIALLALFVATTVAYAVGLWFDAITEGEQ